jgi:hypothetical protein
VTPARSPVPAVSAATSVRRVPIASTCAVESWPWVSGIWMPIVSTRRFAEGGAARTTPSVGMWSAARRDATRSTTAESEAVSGLPFAPSKTTMAAGVASVGNALF